jgi:predicted nucleotidyltransferase component of viral defense system
MNEAVGRMLARYELSSLDDSTQALREILQELALLGLWRGKFFERAAFYGDTALRMLYGLDRFSEDLDFSLLERQTDFDLDRYTDALAREVGSFGFEVTVSWKSGIRSGAIESAFLKANTMQGLITIEARPSLAQALPRNQSVKIKIEVDTDPPSGFATEAKYVLLPIPFSVRTYALPDLFAGKMHAVSCRKWKNRVKGRDWYDFVWFAANHPRLHLAHLEQRMRQSGDWKSSDAISAIDLAGLLEAAIDRLDVEQARREVEPFVKHPAALEVWSREFFRDVAGRIRAE